MITVIDSAKHPVYDRVYYLADTPIGRVVYYQFDKFTQWKNLTDGGIFWTIKPTSEFENIHGTKSVETFASKRLTGFVTNKIKVNCGGDGVYWLAELKNSDGYLYEIPTTELRAFTKKEYPDKKFAYTRYKIDAIKAMDHLTLECKKTEEAVRFNRTWKHSVYAVSTICDAVYKYVKEAN
jgi:hypothetical protein